MNGPHDTSPPRLRQIAEDLSAEGWHTWAGTIAQVADEIEAISKRQLDDCCPHGIGFDELCEACEEGGDPYEDGQ